MLVQNFQFNFASEDKYIAAGVIEAILTNPVALFNAIW